MFGVKTPTLNRQGWHAAHLLEVKDGDTNWRSWPRSSVVWRFVRNIHPCNVFYIPKTRWEQVGKDALLIASVAAAYRERYAAIWAEFADLAEAPAGHGQPAPDGPLMIEASPTSREARGRPEKSHLRRATTPAATEVWRTILQVDHVPPVGVLLARHPSAPALTRRLLARLTVERLIAIADTLHNKCRVSGIRAAAPGDPQRQAELAWTALLVGAGKTHERPSSWTGTAKLLATGRVDGLAAVSALDIGRLAGVGGRIVRGPYREACQRRLR
jgi:hypothetical protein